MTHDHRVIVVGAGFAGIGMAARLRSMGIDDFVVLERGNDLGGTWRDNSYPGCCCDVPSNLYSYSFALNPDWSRSFPSQAEIWDYLRDCVDHFDVGGQLRYGRAVDEARWDEATRHWSVRVADGDEYRAPVLIWATGSLSEPSIPEFPGLREFRGKVFHSAQWEHGFDLRGKRVCVVGTGASAVQFVPQIAPVVEHLYLHQRTPRGSCHAGDHRVSGVRRALYRKVPGAPADLSRFRIYVLFESLLGVFVGNKERRRAAVRSAALAHLRRQVPDKALRAKLTPDYEPGCKRLLLSDDYYPALTRPNVELVDTPVASFTAHEVVGRDGIAPPVDVVIMGTGFEAAEPPYAERIVGSDGAGCSEVWKADGAQAYLGSTVAGFPNLFLMIGPNATLAHNSMIYMIESHIGYIAGALGFLSRPGVHEVEVRRPCSGATTSVSRLVSRTRCGSRVAAAAGTWTTWAATPRSGPTTPGASAV